MAEEKQTQEAQTENTENKQQNQQQTQQHRRPFRRHKKVDYIAANHIEYVDYKDTELLKRFISEEERFYLVE